MPWQKGRWSCSHEIIPDSSATGIAMKSRSLAALGTTFGAVTAPRRLHTSTNHAGYDNGPAGPSSFRISCLMRGPHSPPSVSHRKV